MPGLGGGERAFRYASLSAGLEIVRAGLGKHEIATIQTTAIDTEAGLVRLTTVLAHSSGEWISSDWPVCPVSETASPRRMGAALTYARRYALFTLVGIAGEDDLDAPDMSVPGCPGGPAQSARSDGSGPPSGIRHRNGKASAQPKNVLSSEEAAALREQLLAEVTGLASPEEAAVWAEKVLPLKNALPLGDAQTVEVAFAFQITSLEDSGKERNRPKSQSDNSKAGHQDEPSHSENRDRSRSMESARIDKSVLALPEPRRVRDKAHLQFVAAQPCLICGRKPADAHHLRFAQARALGRKVSDEFTVPLCRGHHREVHRHGDEAAWWQQANVDALGTAEKLWAQTHSLRNRSADALNDDEAPANRPPP